MPSTQALLTAIVILLIVIFVLVITYHSDRAHRKEIKEHIMIIMLLITERFGITDDDIAEAKVRAAAKPAQKDVMTLSAILEVLLLIARNLKIPQRAVKEAIDPKTHKF